MFPVLSSTRPHTGAPASSESPTPHAAGAFEGSRYRSQSSVTTGDDDRTWCFTGRFHSASTHPSGAAEKRTACAPCETTRSCTVALSTTVSGGETAHPSCPTSGPILTAGHSNPLAYRDCPTTSCARAPDNSPARAASAPAAVALICILFMVVSFASFHECSSSRSAATGVPVSDAENALPILTRASPRGSRGARFPPLGV